MAVLNISWQSAGRVAPEEAKEAKVVTASDGGEAKADEPVAKAAPQRAEKPMVVYVSDATPKEGFDKVEKVVLADDKVCVGSKAFTCIRLTPEQAASDKLVNSSGKEVPRILVIGQDYKDVTVLEGPKLTPGALFTAMAAHFKKAYEGDLEATVKGLLKVMIEWDKIGKARAVQEDKEKRAEKPTAKDTAEWKQTKDELDARQKKADEQGEALLKLKPRTAA